MKEKSGQEGKSQSLQTTMVIGMGCLLLFVCGLLVATLYLSQFFTRVDQQGVEVFYSKALSKVKEVDLKLEHIMQSTVSTSQSLSHYFKAETEKFDQTISEANLSTSHYLDSRVNSAEFLLDLLEYNPIDGVFYVLFQEGGEANSGIHIRNVQVNESYPTRDSYEILVGSSEISEVYQLDISENWDLHYQWQKEKNYDYLEKPVESVEKNGFQSLELSGYWSFSEFYQDISVIYYTIPLFDELNQPFGILGIEISSEYFQQEFLSSDDFHYDNTLHFLGTVKNQQLELKAMSEDSDVFWNGILLTDINHSDYHLFEAISNENEVFLGTKQSLTMYDSNSVFYDETLDFLTFVPKSQPYQYSKDIVQIFAKSFLFVLVIGFIGIVFVTRFSTRKIVSLSEYVNHLNPHQELVFEPTNLKEIDDLTTAVKRLNQKIIDSSDALDRIIKLTNLNLGGYEIHPEDSTVILTEYIRNLFCLDSEVLTLEQWEEYYNQLTEQPATDVENTYKFRADGKKVWLRVLSSTNEEGKFGVVMDITKETEEALEVKNQLDYDALTQLYSRAAFHREVNRLLEEDPDMVGAMLFIDLDNLKYTNDTFGHEAGDNLILAASHIFDQFSVYGGVAARFSGDEFAIFIHGYESQKKILKIIQRKFTQFKNATVKVPDGSEQRIRFSTGIAWYPQNAVDVPKLIKLADFAMYQAKHNAKGTMREFDQQVYDETAYIMDNREAINKLIEEGLVDFKFQPIVDLSTGEVFAYEALMRSQLDAFKSPLEILKVAAAQSKSGELEKMLLSKTIATAYEKRIALHNRKLFINSITSQSISEADFAELKETYGKFLENVVIEIKQSEEETQQSRLQKVANIRNCGMEIAIDDFSGGYANEMTLEAINPDLIKMDMSLGQGIAEDMGKRMLLSSIIEYSHGKGIKIIAEGIEQFDDLEQIMLLGVDFVQGYVFARPELGFHEISEDKKEKFMEYLQKINNES